MQVSQQDVIGSVSSILKDHGFALPGGIGELVWFDFFLTFCFHHYHFLWIQMINMSLYFMCVPYAYEATRMTVRFPIVFYLKNMVHVSILTGQHFSTSCHLLFQINDYNNWKQGTQICRMQLYIVSPHLDVEAKDVRILNLEAYPFCFV